jgi:signal transduction histidine kinase
VDHALTDRVRQLVPAAERWLILFVMTRVLAVALAVSLLVAHRITAFDPLLGWLALAYGSVTVTLALGRPQLFGHPVVWGADVLTALGLVLASGDWRSPFYLLALTALAPPAASLPFRRALVFGGAFTALFFGVALLTGLDVGDLRDSARLETLATHLALPGVVTLGLAYAGDVLRRLDGEQRRAQQLAVETERRRIAWELHDSAKQRLHAAHLVLSSLPPSEPLELALEQLRGATADMETSIAELRSPLEGRPLAEALRRRAVELAALDDRVCVAVEGSAPTLPSVTATHAYRILAEAMTNAVRHAEAREVHVRLEADEEGGLRAIVADDGRGLPASIRPGANGLRTMRSRAFAIGGRLYIGSSDPAGAHGVRVRLEVPVTVTETEGVPA